MGIAIQKMKKQRVERKEQRQETLRVTYKGREATHFFTLFSLLYILRGFYGVEILGRKI